MGYYATGDGYIKFKRSLTDREFEAVDELLLEEFDDVGVADDASCVNFWSSDKYHCTVDGILERIAANYPVSEGCVEYAGEDGAHWRFRYDESGKQTESGNCWIEENGCVVYESDADRVAVLEHTWDSEDGEGVQVDLFANIASAMAVMKERADGIRKEYRKLFSRDPWEEDYSWEMPTEIHLGFGPKGGYHLSTVYSWRVYLSEVRK